jgi:hypothetical protein
MPRTVQRLSGQLGAFRRIPTSSESSRSTSSLTASPAPGFQGLGADLPLEAENLPRLVGRRDWPADRLAQ